MSMSEIQNNGLHLPDLSITNFQGIQRLSINKLGRVNLIAGLNGVGKTTLLEAVRTYANRGAPDVFQQLLLSREELTEAIDEDRDPIMAPDYSALFYGRSAIPEQSISIGPKSGKNILRIETVSIDELPEIQQERFSKIYSDAIHALKVTYQDSESILPWLSGASDSDDFRYVSRGLRQAKQLGLDLHDMPTPIRCESLGPGLISSQVLSRYWDKVTLHPEEGLALKAIKIMRQQIERIAVVGDDNRYFRRSGRRVVAKIQGYEKPVPLKSLGEGITRVFATSLALAISHNGFLVIDEVENGIHFSVLKRFWSMVLNASQEYNVQVFATTHSFDCIKAFSRAASELDGSKGTLIRLDGENGIIQAVEYTEEDLEIASDQSIEVR